MKKALNFFFGVNKLHPQDALILGLLIAFSTCVVIMCVGVMLESIMILWKG